MPSLHFRGKRRQIHKCDNPIRDDPILDKKSIYDDRAGPMRQYHNFLAPQIVEIYVSVEISLKVERIIIGIEICNCEDLFCSFCAEFDQEVSDIVEEGREFAEGDEDLRVDRV
jgi:hypothetical protein